MKQINRLHSDGIMVFDKHYDVDFIYVRIGSFYL